MKGKKEEIKLTKKSEKEDKEKFDKLLKIKVK